MVEDTEIDNSQLVQTKTKQKIILTLRNLLMAKH